MPERDCPNCVNPDCPASRALHDVFPIQVSLEDLYNTSINLMDKVMAAPELCPGMWTRPAAPPPPEPGRDSARAQKELKLVRGEAARLERQLAEFAERMQSAESAGSRLDRTLADIHRDLAAMAPAAEQKSERESDRRFLAEVVSRVEDLGARLPGESELDELAGKIEALRASSAERVALGMVESKLRGLEARAALRETVDELSGGFELLRQQAAGWEGIGRLRAEVKELRSTAARREAVEELAARIELAQASAGAKKDDAAAAEVRELAAELRELTGRLDLLEAGSAGRAGVDELRASLADLAGRAAPRAEIERLASEVQLLRAAAGAGEKSDAMPAAWRTELDHVVARLDLVQGEAAEREAVEDLRAKLIDLSSRAADRREVSDLAGRLEEAVAAVRAERETTASAEAVPAAFEDLSARLELVEANAAGREALAEVRAALAELKGQAARRDELERLSARVEIASASVADQGPASAALAALQATLDSLAARLDLVQADAAGRTAVDRLSADLAELKAGAARRRELESLASALEALRAGAAGRVEFDTLASRVEQLRAAAARRDAVDELTARMNDLEPKAATREELGEVAARVERASAESSARTRALAETISEYQTGAAAKDEVRDLARKLEDLKRTAARGADLELMAAGLKDLAKSAARREDLEALARRMDATGAGDRQAREELGARLDQFQAAARSGKFVRTIVAQVEELRAGAVSTESFSGLQETVRGLQDVSRELQAASAGGPEELGRLGGRVAELESGLARLQEAAGQAATEAPPAVRAEAVAPDAGQTAAIRERMRKVESEQGELRRQIRKAFENLTAYSLKDLEELKRKVAVIEQSRPLPAPAPLPARAPAPAPAPAPVPLPARAPGRTAALVSRERKIAVLILVFALAGAVGAAIAGKYTGHPDPAAEGPKPGDTAAPPTEAEVHEYPNTIYEPAGALLAPPVLDLGSERVTLREGAIAVSGYAPGAAEVYLYVNSAPAGEARVENEGFDFGLVALDYGVNVIEVKAVDTAGNETTSLARMIERMSAGTALLKNSSGLNRMRGPRDEPHLALTIDAGSTNRRAEFILDALRGRGIVTTFFLTGRFIEQYPDTVRRIVADGHEAGNHTYSHPHLTSYERDRAHHTADGVTKALVQGELHKTAELFEALTGRKMAPWWRAPYGEYNDRVLAWAEEAGFRHVDWTRTPQNLDMLDWVADPGDRNYLDGPRLLRRLTALGQGSAGRANGSIILMHLGTDRKQDFMDQVLPQALDELTGNGYRFVTVSRMFGGQ